MVNELTLSVYRESMRAVDHPKIVNEWKFGNRWENSGQGEEKEP